MARTKTRGRALLKFVVDTFTKMHTFFYNFRGSKAPDKEADMFEVTTKADEMIQEFFKDKDDKRIIRIFLSQGG